MILRISTLVLVYVICLDSLTGELAYLLGRNVAFPGHPLGLGLSHLAAQVNV
jgi:hypothetical protein